MCSNIFGGRLCFVISRKHSGMNFIEFQTITIPFIEMQIVIASVLLANGNDSIK